MDPVAPTDGSYEQSAQYSVDGGVTWIDPDSLNGGRLWIPVTGGLYCPPFAYPLPAGALVRDCLRRVGTVDELCDVKQVPDPQINYAGTSLVLSNAATEPHPCRDAANDIYTLTIKAYDAGGSLREEFTTTWEPGTSTADFTGAPGDISNALSLGTDGYTLVADESLMINSAQLEFALAVAHVYDCP